MINKTDRQVLSEALENIGAEFEESRDAIIVKSNYSGESVCFNFYDDSGEYYETT